MTPAACAKQVVAGLLAFAACVAPANALPGQTLQQFHAWASTRKLLAGIAQRRDEMSGDPAFALETSDRGIAWTFYATTDGTHIRRESLSVGNPGKPPGSAAIRHDGNGYGYTFFATLYGQAVAHDFLAAKRVASIRDRSDGTVTEFYRGKRYGYSTSGGIVVETISAFGVDLAQAQLCAKSPEQCSE
ncbi:MAG: hypothetical protein ABI431_06915 [Candidatus Tumulicola sp.]